MIGEPQTLDATEYTSQDTREQNPNKNVYVDIYIYVCEPIAMSWEAERSWSGVVFLPPQKNLQSGSSKSKTPSKPSLGLGVST